MEKYKKFLNTHLLALISLNLYQLKQKYSIYDGRDFSFDNENEINRLLDLLRELDLHLTMQDSIWRTEWVANREKSLVRLFNSIGERPVEFGLSNTVSTIQIDFRSCTACLSKVGSKTTLDLFKQMKKY